MNVYVLLLSCVQLFATPWTVAHQASLPMGFFRQEYWNGLPFPPPGDLPDPGIKPTSTALAGGFFTTEPPGKPRVGTKLWKALETSGNFQKLPETGMEVSLWGPGTVRQGHVYPATLVLCVCARACMHA